MPPSVRSPRSRPITLLAAAAVLVLAWSAWWFVDEAPSLRPSAREAPGSAAPEALRTPPELEPPEDVGAPSPEARGERAVAAAERREPTLQIEPARLVVRAEDRSPLGPLRGFDVRVASDTRFAAEHGTADGELELPLTPGTYAVVVAARGCEPAEIARVELTSGATVRLDPVVMQPGSACIRGAVFDALGMGRSVVVELIGAGRRPCERCIEPSDVDGARPAGAGVPDAKRSAPDAWERRDPCRACGYARDASRFELRAGDGFAFGNLVHGEYVVRLTDQRGAPLGDEERLQLLPGGSGSVVLDASRSRMVELDFVDVDGSSLATLWSRRLAVLDEEVPEEEIVGSEVVTDFAIDLVVEDELGERARARLDPPLPSGVGMTLVGVSSGRSVHVSRDFALRRRTVVDRARTAEDRLLLDPAAPRFPVAQLECEVAASGLALLGPLPTSALKLRATRSTATAEAVVPAATATTRVRLRLQAP